MIIAITLAAAKAVQDTGQRRVVIVQERDLFKSADGFGGFPDDLPLTSRAEDPQIYLPWRVATLISCLLDFGEGHTN